MASCGTIDSAPLLSDADRFQLLGRLLEKTDLEFLRQSPSVAMRLRISRARIFRAELGSIRNDVYGAFRSRLNRIAENGQWTRVPGLMADTASAYAAISKLEIDAALFRYNIPTAFHVSPNTERLYRYFSLTAPA